MALVCAVLGLERDGRLIAERGMQALAVIDLVDEGADVARRVAVIAIASAVDLFALEGSDEALGLGVVVGIADPAHAGGDALALQEAGVLGTTDRARSIPGAIALASRAPPR